MTDENVTQDVDTAPEATPAETPEAQKQDAEPSDATDENQEAPDEAKKQESERVQKRIDKAVARQRDAERREQEATRRIQELEAQLKPKPEEAPPKEDDFERHEDFLKAQGAFEERQKAKADAEAKALKEQSDLKTEKERSFAQKFGSEMEKIIESDETAEEALQDLGDLLASIPETNPSRMAWNEYLREYADNPAKLTVAVAKDADVLEKLKNAQSKGQFFKILTRLEDSLSQPIQKAQPKQPPAPPSPIKGKAKAGKDPTEMSVDEIMKSVRS